MVIQDLLRYQETDGKLRTIEQEIAASDERKKYMTARKFLEKAPEKLEALDAKAAELKHIFELLTDKYAEIADTIKDYENLDEMVEQAFDDQCTGANPRYPLISEIRKMYLNAYYGKHEPV